MPLFYVSVQNLVIPFADGIFEILVVIRIVSTLEGLDRLTVEIECRTDW